MIKFWLAKYLAELLWVVGLLVACVVIFFLVVFGAAGYGWVRRRLGRAK